MLWGHFQTFFHPLTRRLWNFSSIYLSVMNSLFNLFSSMNRKVTKLFIHLHGCYETNFKPFFCLLTRRLQNFSSTYMSFMRSLSNLFSSINKKVMKLFIHLRECYEITFKPFFCPLTRRLWNFSSTYMSVVGSLSNLRTEEGYVW
jgi:hypothetical protein